MSSKLQKVIIGRLLMTSFVMRSSLLLLFLLLVFFLLPVAAARCQESDPVAVRKYSVALGFQRKGLYPQAAERWAQFVKAYPKSERIARAYYHLGVCQIQTKKYSEAIATFRQIATQHPKFPQLDNCQFNVGLALYNTALTSSKKTDFQLAAAAFADLRTRFPQSGLLDRAYYYQAECLCLSGQLDKAVPLYQEVIAKHPKSPLLPQLYFSLGATQQDMDKQVEALGTLKQLVAKFPKDPLVNDARLRVGVALLSEKKYGESEKLFAQLAAVKEFPQADLATLHYGQSLFEQQKMPQAAAAFESIPKKFAKSSWIDDALLAAGKARLRANQLPQASADLTVVVDRKQSHAAEATYWLARVLVRQNKALDAVKRLDQAIALYPKSDLLTLCRFGRIDALSHIESRRKEAAADFARFAESFPKDGKAPEALYRAALESLKLEDHKTALAHCQKFLADSAKASQPLAIEVLLVGAETALQAPNPLQNPVLAEQYFRKIVSTSPNHANAVRAQVGIGAALYQQKKHAPALAHLASVEKALAKSPDYLAESRLIQGRCQLDSAQPAKAVPILRSAFSTSPKWNRADEVLLVLAVSLQSAGDSKAAIVELNKLLATQKSSRVRDQALYQLGAIFQQEKKYSEAIAQFQLLQSKHAASDLLPAALFGMGACNFEQQKYSQALPHLDKLLSQFAKSKVADDARYLRGITRLRLNQFQPATGDLAAFLAAAPKPPKLIAARFAQARCYAGLKQFDKTILGLQQIIKEHSKYERLDDVYYELGFALLELKKQAEAAEAFRNLASQFPSSSRAAECWYRVGEFQEQQQKLTEAAAAYDAGLKAKPTKELQEKLTYKSALIEFQQQRFPQSLKILEQHLKQFPNGPLSFAARYLRSECLYGTQQYETALAGFQEIIQSNDEKAVAVRPRCLYRAGSASGSLKNWPESQAFYHELVEKFPKFPQRADARYGLGIALQNQQQLEPAIAAFRQVVDGHPDTEAAAKSWFMMGQCLFAQKKYQMAIDCFSEVAFGYKHEQWQPLSYFEAGRCYILLKRNDAATKMLQTVVRDFPKHPRAKDAATILNQIQKE